MRLRDIAEYSAVGLVLVFASCGRSPTSPHPPEQGPAATGAIVRVDLVAPVEIAPGESVQLRAEAIKSDGSVENVSSQAQWTPTNSPVVLLSPTGLATGQTRGEQVVSARFSGRTGTARIFVLPTGTFRLGGTIQDSGFGIQNVAVTVIAGIGQGSTTLSGVDGAFALYGVGGPVTIQLKKGGYLNSIQQVDVTAHRSQNFVMDPERPRQDYNGAYTLTITAASGCTGSPTALPDEATRRIYAASVTQDGGRLTVTLTGSDFIVTAGYGNRFFGFVDPGDTITFPIGDPYYFHYYDEHYQIVERFRDGALIVVGNVAARGARGLITGTLAGAIATARRVSPPYGAYSGSCYAPTHRFEMVRR